MKFTERLIMALVIVAADTAVLVVPVCAVLLAYVLLARPPWFKNWVDRIYLIP